MHPGHPAPLRTALAGDFRVSGRSGQVQLPLGQVLLGQAMHFPLGGVLLFIWAIQRDKATSIWTG